MNTVRVKTMYYSIALLLVLVSNALSNNNENHTFNRASGAGQSAAMRKQVNNIRNSNNNQHQHMTPSRNEQHQQQEQLKKEKQRLIEIFKEKLLEILNIKDLPLNGSIEQNSSIVFKGTNEHNIPDPVLKEYERVLEENENRKSSHLKNLTAGLYLNDEASAELELKIQKNKERDEQTRFTSFIEEITLLPKQPNLNCKNSSQQGYEFERVSCFDIELENKEFYEFDIDSAKLYLKLTSNQINNLNYLFIEVNDELVKKFDIKQSMKKVGQNIDEENNVDDEDESSLYEFVELRDIITNYLVKTEMENAHQRFLRPKLSIKLLNMKDNSNSELNLHLFKNMFEQVALIVKFGERTIREFKYQELCKKTPNLKYCQELHLNSKTARSKRSAIDKYFQKETPQRQIKQFYECDEVRNSGHAIPPNKCCRESITISLKEIGWDNWIARPDKIDFKYCRGGCTGMLTSKYYHTNLVQRSLQVVAHPYLEQTQCCNIHDYDEAVTLLYIQNGVYQIGQFQISAKNCMCS